MSNRVVQKWFRLCLWIGLGFSLGFLPSVLHPSPARSAEQIRFAFGPLDFSIPIKSLETFANEGKIDSDFAFYAKRLKPQQLALLRQVLQKQFKASPVTVDRLTQIQMADELLKRLGQVIQTDSRLNGFYAIRSALLLASTDPEGLTVLNILRRYPTKDIRLNTSTLLQLAREVSTFYEYRDAIVNAVSQEAATEASADPPFNYAGLPNLGKPGAFRVVKETLTFPVSALRPTQQGLARSYDLIVDVYLPEGRSQPAPLIVVTHGFGSTRTSYAYIAQHLASHGFVVAAPEHIGSDLYYRQTLISQGGINVDISPLEFISRNRDISFTLDELQNLAATNPTWATRINFEQIGVLGNSFGGSTALSVAGATLNQARLSQECTPDKHILNASVLLQCRASYLPPQDYRFADSRIKAAFAAYPLTSVMFGPEGLSTLNVPTFIMAGSRDVFTPFITEQVHPFIWLNTPEKYLAVLVNGTHFSTSEDATNAKLPSILKSPRPDLGREYFQGMSTAFFQVYLEKNADAKRYLTSSYASALGQEPLNLKLIRSLTPAQLETAYGGLPPFPIIPAPAVAAAPPQRKESVLQEIKRSGTLKVAIRTDSAPFGYIDSQKQVWTGYCSALVGSLADHLEQTLQVPGGVNVVELQSTAETRFKLVRDNAVHLECGPDTIQRNVNGVTFSNPFFVTGTQFLVEKGNASKVNPAGLLEGLRVGVLKDTLTDQFIASKYPKTEAIPFQGQTGRAESLQALTTGKVDALAGDGVLLVGELLRQKLSLENYTLLPQRPLTCDYYGLVLPNNDAQWRDTINNFMANESAKQIQLKWLNDAIPTALSDADYCLSR